MVQVIEPTTNRIRLRQWAPRDRRPFAAMSADPQVMAYFPSTLSKSESDAIADHCEATITANGWGVWVAELLDTDEFIGIIGLNVPQADLPCSPCVEVLWRLARPYWGHGYATEAAGGALQAGFQAIGLDEIVSFTVPGNLRSRAVMERLHMHDSGVSFDHPEVPEPSNLRKHCLYRISRETWVSRSNP